MQQPLFFIVCLAPEGQHALTVGGVVAEHEVECFLCLFHGPSVGDRAAQVHLALIDQIDDLLELTVLQAAPWR